MSSQLKFDLTHTTYWAFLFNSNLPSQGNSKNPIELVKLMLVYANWNQKKNLIIRSKDRYLKVNLLILVHVLTRFTQLVQYCPNCTRKLSCLHCQSMDNLIVCPFFVSLSSVFACCHLFSTERYSMNRHIWMFVAGTF